MIKCTEENIAVIAKSVLLNHYRGDDLIECFEKELAIYDQLDNSDFPSPFKNGKLIVMKRRPKKPDGKAFMVTGIKENHQ